MSDIDQNSPRETDDEKPVGPHPPPQAPEPQSCDICGSTELVWLRCKLICNQCHTILMTCGDL